MSEPEVMIVTQQQLEDGWRSFDLRSLHGRPVDAPLEAQHHRFEVIEGPRPDKTYLVRAPGFHGVPVVEIKILNCIAQVLNVETERLEHPDRQRRKVAAAWVPVCESALRGNQADRTEALRRYAELVAAGVLEHCP